MNSQQKKNKPVRKKKPLNIQKILIILTFIVYMILQIIIAIKDAKHVGGTVQLLEFYEMVDRGEVESVEINQSSNLMVINKTDGSIVNTINPQNDTFIYELVNKGINVSIQKTSLFDSMVTIIVLLPTTIVLLLIITYLTNTVIGGNVKMFTLLDNKHNHTRFDDIKGLGKTKDEVQFIVNQLKNWNYLGKLGARPCKGVLLYGPPGTGKTMLAKAIAKEAGVSFISASASDFDEVFVGVGAARIRSLWDLASFNAPCILFIDEIDCLGKRRSGRNNDNNQTLNALLQKMDGLNVARGIMVIAATNRKEDIDPALLRPGRFDKHYYIGAPDNKKDRDELVEVYLKNKLVDTEVTVEKASKLLIGLSGAEIEQVLNEAVYLSLQDSRDGVIRLSDIDEATMQLHTGGVREEHSSDRDEEITAIHEAGHTIASLALGLDICKVSIIPYSSGTGGLTMRDCDKDGDIKLKFLSDYEKDIKVLLAGKVAEDLLLGSHTQGCSNDIERATKVVYEMVTYFAYDTDSIFNENVLVNSGIKQSVNRDRINQCNKKLKEYNEDTYKLLREHEDKLVKLKELLLKKKTIVNPTLDMFK